MCPSFSALQSRNLALSPLQRADNFKGSTVLEGTSPSPLSEDGAWGATLLPKGAGG